MQQTCSKHIETAGSKMGIPRWDAELGTYMSWAGWDIMRIGDGREGWDRGRMADMGRMGYHEVLGRDGHAMRCR